MDEIDQVVKFLRRALETKVVSEKDAHIQTALHIASGLQEALVDGEPAGTMKNPAG